VEGVEVRNLTAEPQGTVALTLAAPAGARQSLARQCLDAGLELDELRTEQHGLEDLFVELLGEGRPA